MKRSTMNETGNIDEICAKSVPAEPASGKWQPIETAPQDGTYVLVAGRYDSPHVAGFLPIYRAGQRRWISVGCDGAAIRSQDDFGTEYQESGPLTHWMPIPNPPEIEP